jgi:Uncharacterized conserved protein (DUF2267)
VFWARPAAGSTRAAAYQRVAAGLPGWTLGSFGVPTKPEWWCAMNHAELLQQVQAAAARLPDELQAVVAAGPPSCQPFDADEFVGRVAERVGVQPQAAWTQVRAVLGTLDREVAGMQAVRQRLPREFDALMV